MATRSGAKSCRPCGRQLFALAGTYGRKGVRCLKARIVSVNVSRSIAALLGCQCILSWRQRSSNEPPPTHKSCKLGEIDNACYCRSATYVEMQLCKTRDFFCKRALLANWPRCRHIPYRNHFARTDTPRRCRAQKNVRSSRAGRCRAVLRGGRTHQTLSEPTHHPLQRQSRRMSLLIHQIHRQNAMSPRRDTVRISRGGVDLDAGEGLA
jgi:hypothetical protein